jgi:hypothetical protein
LPHGDNGDRLIPGRRAFASRGYEDCIHAGLEGSIALDFYFEPDV